VKVLLHCCCGPCATVCVEHLRAGGDEVTGLFYNPNIDPREELARRARTMEQAAQALSLPMASVGDGMRPLDFMLYLAAEGGRRCRACYALRLDETARRAAEGGFGGFSTTLLISPYQDLEAVREVGERAAAKHRVVFRFADLRDRYAESRQRSRSLGLYRQNYCGCLFSRLERAERRARRAVARAAARRG